MTPAEVDMVLTGYNGVRDCAVIGLQEESRGQLVAAVVIIDGHLPDTVPTARDVNIIGS